jgi:two-component system, NtrC family, sensor histidine kinase HydH
LRLFIRPQDFLWLALFAALAVLSPSRTPAEYTFLPLLALLQVLEPRIALFTGARGQYLSIFFKLALGYALIGFTGGINSSYYLILLLPIVSAATSSGAVGTTVFTLLSCCSYVSMLLYIDWTTYELPGDQTRELALRLAFFAVVGFLTYTLAEANRVEARKYQAVARQLAEANQSLREAEAAVRRSERLAALGQLTAGLAHELRNPLGTMRASAEVLSKNVAHENDVAQEVAGFISTEVDRANSLITRFLEFARPLPLRLKPADIAETIDLAVARLERENAAVKIAIYKNYSPDIRPFPYDAELIERVVYNLVLNAIQATPAGGEVTVKTRPVDGQVEITVIDRGSGIDPKDLESVFNPFFTTKPNGVGLGLAIVSKIVDEHGGRVSLESEPDKGTVARALLPLDHDPPN